MNVFEETIRSISDFENFLISSRRHLHQYPEVGFNEFETSRFIKKTLESHGLKVHGPLASTGLYVDIEGHLPGAHVGYRADIDALPIQDAKHVSYASKNAGVAHLCGHDVHTTTAIGIALLLNENREAFAGTIRVFFQPNEEGQPSGAPMMIEEGILNGLEAVYAIHVDPTLAVGKYGLIKGAATAAATRFNVAVKSPSTGHSARPHESIDTIWVSSQIANQFYQLVGRLSDPRNPTILTICRFHGGEAYNVIPNHVEFGGTLRSTSLETRRELEKLMTHTAHNMMNQVEANVEVSFDEGIPPVINDRRLIDHIAQSITSVIGKDAIHHILRPSMGGEDFANYQQYIPGALIRVGTFSNPRTAYPLHDAHFDIDESAIVPTVNLMTRILLDHLNSSPLSS